MKTKFLFLKRLGLSAVFCGVGFFGFSTAQADTLNGLINVTITLTSSCVINGTLPIDGGTFGTLNFGTQPTQFTTTTAQVQGTSGAFTMHD